MRETLEDVRQEFRRDAFARVADADLDVRVDARQHELHAPALRRELHGVGDEIPDDLLQPIRVAVHGHTERLDDGLQAHAFASAAGRTDSSAESMTEGSSTRCTSSRILPDVMRLMSSKSEISCVCTRAFRSMTSTPRAVTAGSSPFLRRRWVQPRIAFSGVRSSCDSVARKSSLSCARPLDRGARLLLVLEQHLPLLVRVPQLVVQARVVDGDCSLRGDTYGKALRFLVEHADVRVAENRPPMTSPLRDSTGAAQVAAHGQVALRHPLRGVLWP